MKTRQSGFTLVEIAIVLVIIGLLLGGVLKGQELIDNAKVKNAANDMTAISTAYNSYIDRFRTLPGDDGPLATLLARGGPWTTITVAGNANGVLLTPVASVFTNAAEEDSFWQHLRAAGFVTGDHTVVGVAALPRNAFNGLTGVGTGVTPAVGVAVNSVCMSQVPGKLARALDTQLDNGVPSSGSVLATLGAAGANTAPGAAAATYVEGSVYTVCRVL